MPATINCPQCGKALAPHAAMCSQCRYSLKKEGARPRSLLLLVALLLVAAGLFARTLNAKKPQPLDELPSADASASANPAAPSITNPLAGLTSLVASEETGAPYMPKPGTNKVDQTRVATYLETYRQMSDQQLSDAMNETDYDKRAAASRIRLERAGVPITADGVDFIQSRYLSNPGNQAYGFTLLGSLVQQGIGEEQATRIVLRFVEDHPQDAACDYALWALGETGSTEALEHFYTIAADTARYGAVARERSFCCVSQCGRYSAQTRYENIPRMIELAKRVPDAQTQNWCLMALRDMAPGVNLSSISEWESWWQKQTKLRASKAHV